MKSREQLTSHSTYAKELRGRLPAKAFAAAPTKLWLVLAHLLILAAGYFGFRSTSSISIFAILSLIIAHSMACIAFLAHELSHNAIIRSRPFRYPLEVFLWALNLIPATVWKRVHNQSHHVHTNTLKDPDRRFLKSEESLLTRWYSRLFYPQRSSMRWNPLVLSISFLISFAIRSRPFIQTPPHQPLCRSSRHTLQRSESMFSSS